MGTGRFSFIGRYGGKTGEKDFLRSLARRNCALYLFLAIAICIVLSSPIQAQEPTFTVGVDTTCPYGIVNCWPEVREPIEGLHGVKSVSARIDPKTLTCEIQMEHGLLLDAKALNAKVRADAGDFFSIRGVEANLTGSLCRKRDRLALRIGGKPNLVFLTQLQQKVQKDPATKISVPPTAEEQSAYERLAAEWNGKQTNVRIVGPLVLMSDRRTILEVRKFDWIDIKAAPQKE